MRRHAAGLLPAGRRAARSATRTPAEWVTYDALDARRTSLLKRPPASDAPLTNEFLPGEGLDPGASRAGMSPRGGRARR